MLDVPEQHIPEHADHIGEVILTWKDAGGRWLHQSYAREGFIATQGDSLSEVVALRVVQLLKEWNGEKPLDTSDLKIGGA